MPRGHFNVLHAGSGGMLTTSQDNASHAVKANQTGIVRGSVLMVDTTEGAWVLATDNVESRGDANTPGPILYFALNDQGEPDVRMSGVLTALPCTASFPFETDQLDTDETWALGTYASAGAEGKLVPHTAGYTAVAVMIKAPFNRWINDKLHATELKTGGIGTVAHFRAIFQPQFAPTPA